MGTKSVVHGMRGAAWSLDVGKRSKIKPEGRGKNTWVLVLTKLLLIRPGHRTIIGTLRLSERSSRTGVKH